MTCAMLVNPEKWVPGYASCAAGRGVRVRLGALRSAKRALDHLHACEYLGEELASTLDEVIGFVG